MTQFLINMSQASFQVFWGVCLDYLHTHTHTKSVGKQLTVN